MGILVAAEKCTGCRICELVCCLARAQSCNPNKARIKVVNLDLLGFSNPVLCISCKKPRCVEICPTEALSLAKLGTIHVNEEKCNGCRVCVDECFMGAINFDEEKGLPLICDLCDGRPLCVEWCPAGVLTYDSWKRSKERKELNYTILEAKPFLEKRGIAEDTLDWYKKFTGAET